MLRVVFRHWDGLCRCWDMRHRLQVPPGAASTEGLMYSFGTGVGVGLRRQRAGTWAARHSTAVA
jgi:hypothetical protein